MIVDETTEGVRVRVLDTGVGIDPDEAAKLFELYYRSPETAARVSGAGIGLFVCRVLVESMGGRIWASPRPDGGSEFGFVLQRYEDGRESDGRTKPPRPRTDADASGAGQAQASQNGARGGPDDGSGCGNVPS